MMRPPRRRRAVILVLVLWIVVVLSLIAYSMLFEVSTEATLASARKKHFRAEALARAGLAKAIVDLQNDALFDASAEDNRAFDAEGDVWARPEEDKDGVSLGNDADEDGTYSVVVADEEGLININQLGPRNLVLVETILEDIGLTEDDAKVVAASIVDWRDGDTQPILANAMSNEEGLAYALYEAEADGGKAREDDVDPFVLRNENYVTVDELLEVYGVTPEAYFGPGSPEAEYYAAKLGDRYNGRFLPEEKRRRRDEPGLGLRDYFTVLGIGTINVNTAPAHVLAAMGRAAGRDDGDDFAERVIKTRRGGADDDIDNDGAFKSVQEIQSNADIGGTLVAASALCAIGVTSTAFRVRSEGVVGTARCTIDAVVVRELATLRRDETLEGIERAAERRDRNKKRWDRRRDKKDEAVVRYPIVRILESHID